MSWIKLIVRLFENPENIFALIGTILSIILLYFFWKYLLKFLLIILKALAIIPMWIGGSLVLLITKIGGIGDTQRLRKYRAEQETLRKEKVAQLRDSNKYENQMEIELNVLHDFLNTPMTRRERYSALKRLDYFLTEESIESRNEIDRALSEDYRLHIDPINEKEKNWQISYGEAKRLLDEKYDEILILDLEGLQKSAHEHFLQEISKL